MPRNDLARIQLSGKLAAMIAELVEEFRPDWPAVQTRSILESYPNADALPVAIASLRAAGNPDLPHPRAIMWRGAHWSGLEGALPDKVKPARRCSICSLTEELCYTAPGRRARAGVSDVDDHPFTPA